MIKVLLTDSLNRKSFDLYNILNRYKSKYKILICPDKKNLFSYFLNLLVYWKIPCALRTDNYNNFCEDLTSILESNAGYEIVYIPVEEKTTLLFYEFIQKNSFPNLKYKLPSQAAFNLTRDKLLLMKFCEREQIPHPVTYDYPRENLLDVDTKQFIIKPRVGSGAEDVKYINSQEDLKVLNEINPEEVVIQEKIKNGREVIGAFYLFDNNKLVLSYCHQRIRTFPEEGGVTVFSKLVTNDEVVSSGEKLLKLLNWDGLAMIEFLFDPADKKYKVIEINPRLWGSILVSEFSNINMIENYIELSLKRSPKSYAPKTDTKIRWFFPYDIILFFKKSVGTGKFWSVGKNTCYINFTYANKIKAFIFLLVSVFSLKNLKKLLKKM